MKKNVRIAKELIRIAKNIVSNKKRIASNIKINFNDTQENITKDYIKNFNSYPEAIKYWEENMSSEDMNYYLNHLQEFEEYTEGFTPVKNECCDYLYNKIKTLPFFTKNNVLIKKDSSNEGILIGQADEDGDNNILYIYIHADYIQVDYDQLSSLGYLQQRESFKSMNDLINNIEDIFIEVAQQTKLQLGTGKIYSLGNSKFAIEFVNNYYKNTYLKRFIKYLNMHASPTKIIKDQGNYVEILVSVISIEDEDMGSLVYTYDNERAKKTLQECCHYFNLYFD